METGRRADLIMRGRLRIAQSGASGAPGGLFASELPGTSACSCA
jgi:hypothetical protein